MMGALHSGYFTRQHDLMNLDALRAIPIYNIGMGATGGWSALKMGKLGASRMIFYDHDVVEDLNVNAQIFGPSHVGMSKVQAAAEILQLLAGVTPEIHQEKFEGQVPLSGIVILCVDTMVARKRIWEKSVKYNPNIRLFLETRMAPQAGRVFAIRPCDPDHVRYFEATMDFTDEEAIQTPCTGTAIVYNSSTVSDLVARAVRNHIQGDLVEIQVTYNLEGCVYHMVVNQPPI